MVHRVAIFRSSLVIMTRFAQRLPIGPVPEQLHVASVWLAVIHHGCSDEPSPLHAHLTKRVRCQEPLALSSPCSTIPSGRCRPHFLRVQSFVFITILHPRWHKVFAARVPAGCVWFVGHVYLRASKKPRRSYPSRHFKFYLSDYNHITFRQ